MADTDVVQSTTDDDDKDTVDTDVVVDADVDKNVDKDKVDKADYDKVFARMQAADRAKTDAEKKLADLDKAKLGDLERATAERDEAVKLNEELTKAVTSLRVENAFHRENKYTWHDSADALAALDMSSVEIGEDGQVTGLKAAIDDVAKRKPHFVKKNDKADPPPVASGDPANGKRKGEPAETADRKALRNRFPALNK